MVSLETSSALHDIHKSWFEGSLQNWDRLQGLSFTAHEDIQRSIASLWPRVNGDVALREHENSRNSPIGLEVVQMAVKNSCSRDNSGLSKSCLDNFSVV
jgi:hypothetical protein